MTGNGQTRDQILERAVKEYGTPLYVFDEAELSRRAAYLRDLMPSGVELCYAMKANPFVAAFLSKIVDRVEVCSPGELDICRAMGIDPEKLVISGVYKSRGSMEPSIRDYGDAGRYTIESEEQYELLRDIARAHGTRLKTLVRLTSGNQFGMDEASVTSVIERSLEEPSIDVRGIQYFSGTQKTSIKRVAREFDQASAALGRINAALGLELAELEYGTGFPVQYYGREDEAEARREERAFLQEFSELLAPIAGKYDVTLEIGRSYVASCGTYLTSIVDAKINDGEAYAIVDGGLHQITYYGGGLSMKTPPCRMFAGTGDDGQREWTICGSLCSVNDILVKRMPLAGVRPGAVMAFDLAGAYCMTEGISLFLSRDIPAIVFANENGTLRLARDHVSTYDLNMPQGRPS